MTLEQRLILMLGQRDMAIADLETKLEQAQKRIAELEKKEKEAPQ